MKSPLRLAAFALLALAIGAGCRSQEERSVAPGDEAALAELDPNQRAAALDAMAEAPCACGRGTFAECRAIGGRCPISARAFAQAIELARLGSGAAEIREALARGPTAATAPPALARNASTAARVAAGHRHLHARAGRKPPGAGNN
jgi:hypothetical protein